MDCSSFSSSSVKERFRGATLGLAMLPMVACFGGNWADGKFLIAPRRVWRRDEG